MIFARSLRSRWWQEVRCLGRGPTVFIIDQKGLPVRQWAYLGEVPSGEEVSKTQEWGREYHGRDWTLRRKNYFSEAKLGKMMQSDASWTASWSFSGQEPCCLPIWLFRMGLKGVSRVELRSVCICLALVCPVGLLPIFYERTWPSLWKLSLGPGVRRGSLQTIKIAL